MTAAPRTVLFATAEQFTDLTPDDTTLARALAARGIEVRPVVWSRTEPFPTDVGSLVIRSCWDYHRHADRFVAWLQSAQSAGIAVFNPVSVVEWNVRKRYLLELEAKGMRIIPTMLLSNDYRSDDVAALAGPSRTVVIKPEVSASAEGIWIASLPLDAGAVARLDADVARHPMLVQPFIETVRHTGEVSLVYIRGEFSHAVHKRPAPGDFRVQAEHGGSAQRIEPPRAAVSLGYHAISAAAAILGLTSPDFLYTRVDIIESNGWMLSELELIEPTLYLTLAPESIDVLADAIATATSGTVGVQPGAGHPRL